MSYDQTFKGSFTYADERCLEAGLDRFVERTAEGRSIVGLDDLRIDGLVVHVAMDTSAPEAREGTGQAGAGHPSPLPG